MSAWLTPRNMVIAVLLTFKLGLGELGLWWGLLSGITATGACGNHPLVKGV